MGNVERYTLECQALIVTNTPKEKARRNGGLCRYLDYFDFVGLHPKNPAAIHAGRTDADFNYAIVADVIDQRNQVNGAAGRQRLRCLEPDAIKSIEGHLR